LAAARGKRRRRRREGTAAYSAHPMRALDVVAVVSPVARKSWKGELLFLDDCAFQSVK